VSVLVSLDSFYGLLRETGTSVTFHLIDKSTASWKYVVLFIGWKGISLVRRWYDLHTWI